MATDLEILEAPDAGAAPTTNEASGAASATAAPEAADAGLDWAALEEEPATEAAAPSAPRAAQDATEDATTEPAAAPATTRAGEAEESPAGRYGAPGLSKLLAADAKLAEAINASPAARAQLYRMARRSGELADMQAVIPTPAAARQAKEQAEALADMDRLYQSDDPREFLERLYEAQTVVGPDGQRRSSGAYERAAQYQHRALFAELEQHAASQGDDDLAAAVAKIREVLPWAAASSRSQHGLEARALPSDVRASLARGEQAKRELEQIRRQSGEQRERQAQAWLDDTAAEVAEAVGRLPESFLAKTAFNDFEKRAIAREWRDRVLELAGQDPAHQARLDEIIAGGGQPAAMKKALLDEATRWARGLAREELAPIVGRASAARSAAAAARPTPRAEPATAGAAQGISRPSPVEMVSALAHKLGRRPTDRELLDA